MSSSDLNKPLSAARNPGPVTWTADAYSNASSRAINREDRGPSPWKFFGISTFLTLVAAGCFVAVKLSTDEPAPTYATGGIGAGVVVASWVWAMSMVGTCCNRKNRLVPVGGTSGDADPEGGPGAGYTALQGAAPAAGEGTSHETTSWAFVRRQRHLTIATTTTEPLDHKVIIDPS